MQKSTKTLLGIATFWPIAYMFLFFAFMFTMVLSRGGAVETMFPLIFLLHLLTMILIMALTVFYIVDIFKNNRVEKDKKALWAIVIFMGNAVAMPIYWYLYFWKEPAVTTTFAPGQLGSADTSAWTSQPRVSREESEQYVPPREPPNWR